jgi:hypothetical protein
MEQPISLSSSADQELQYIRNVIAESRKSLAEDGKPYIVWGLIVAAGMTISYLEFLLQKNLYAGYFWLVLVLFGYINIFFSMRKKKRQTPRVKSFIDRLQGTIWGVCGSLIGLVIFLVMIGYSLPDYSDKSYAVAKINPMYICFFTALLTGIGYFLSGAVLEIKWLRNIAFAWWAGAVLMFLWPTPHMLGIYALMMICFQVVPGIMLNRKYREMQQSGAAVGA